MGESPAEEQWARRRSSFGTAAQAYAYGRPSYPPEAVRWVLPADARTVLDLAAGTGKLTEGLLALGLDVVAVEPSAEMRAFVPGAARALDGTAEAIPLADASVDAIVVGQAYHWFDPVRALPEMARVLRPGGTLGLFWNLDDDRVPWVAQLCERTDSEARMSTAVQDPRPPYDGRQDLSTPVWRRFDHDEDYDADRLVAMIASRSMTILLDEDERERLLDDVRALAPAGNFRFPSVCEVWRAERAGTSP